MYIIDVYISIAVATNLLGGEMKNSPRKKTAKCQVHDNGVGNLYGIYTYN